MKTILVGTFTNFFPTLSIVEFKWFHAYFKSINCSGKKKLQQENVARKIPQLSQLFLPATISSFNIFVFLSKKTYVSDLFYMFYRGLGSRPWNVKCTQHFLPNIWKVSRNFRNSFFPQQFLPLKYVTINFSRKWSTFHEILFYHWNKAVIKSLQFYCPLPS